MAELFQVRDGRTDIRELSGDERMELLTLAKSPVWNVVLNIMEEVCLAQQTIMVNVEVGENEKIIGQHAVSKAMWLFFVRFQERVRSEINAQIQPELFDNRTEEEKQIARILNPLEPSQDESAE